MRQDDVTRLTVKSVEEPLSDVFIRKMAETRKNPLLQFPRILLDCLQHVAAVIRLDHDRRATTKPFHHQSSDTAKVHRGCDLHSVMPRGKDEVIYRIVRNREWVKVDLADREVL